MKGSPLWTLHTDNHRPCLLPFFVVCGDLSTGGCGGRYTNLVQCPHTSMVEKLYRFTSFWAFSLLHSGVGRRWSLGGYLSNPEILTYLPNYRFCTKTLAWLQWYFLAVGNTFYYSPLPFSLPYRRLRPSRCMVLAITLMFLNTLI